MSKATQFIQADGTCTQNRVLLPTVIFFQRYSLHSANSNQLLCTIKERRTHKSILKISLVRAGCGHLQGAEGARALAERHQDRGRQAALGAGRHPGHLSGDHLPTGLQHQRHAAAGESLSVREVISLSGFWLPFSVAAYLRTGTGDCIKAEVFPCTPTRFLNLCPCVERLEAARMLLLCMCLARAFSSHLVQCRFRIMLRQPSSFRVLTTFFCLR
jgi:hypothetical protein